MTWRAPFVALAVALIGNSATAQQPSASARARATSWNRPSHADSVRLFYKGYGYGSDAYNTPLTVLLNKGYDIFQLRLSPRNFWTFPYKSSWRYAVVESFRAPAPAIDRFGGWRRFARIELYPSSWDIDEWNWLANYSEHFLGGGFTMRAMDEWYRAHGVPWPRLWAMATTYAASMLNEVAEQEGLRFSGAGAVADLLVFDLGAILLFHWNQPAHFFAKTLQVADWSNQAAFTFPNRQLQNNGQYYAMKIPIGLARTRFFLRGGMGAQFGISRKLADDEHHFSAAVGGDTRVRDVDQTGHETVRFAPAAGVYYDRNNSLLWSVTSSPAENVLAVNVYPGVLPASTRRLGVWAVYTRRNQARVGLVYGRALGLGIGYGR